MKEKLENAWMKVGKFLFWALVTALCCCLTYMVFVHRASSSLRLRVNRFPRSLRVSTATNSARRNNRRRAPDGITSIMKKQRNKKNGRNKCEKTS